MGPWHRWPARLPPAGETASRAPARVLSRSRQGQGKVEIADVRYIAAWHTSGKRPTDLDTFSRDLQRLCRELKLEVDVGQDQVFLLDVQLTKAASSA